MVVGIGDGGNWIDPLLDAHVRPDARVIDWYHASEHLWDCAKAAHGAGTPRAAQMGEHLEALLWDGRVADVVAALRAESDRLGPPQDGDGRDHPRRVPANNVGYFTRHGLDARHMDYPTFRKNGWPVASGDAEAGVKQHGRRVKGSDQFWSEPGVESVLALRSLWLAQDDRWKRHWSNRRAYVN